MSTKLIDEKSIFYHTSNPCYRRSIKSKGLIAQIGECYDIYSKSVGDEPKPCIFINKDVPWDSEYGQLPTP